MLWRTRWQAEEETVVKLLYISQTISSLALAFDVRWLVRKITQCATVPRFNIQNLILFYNLLKCVKGSDGM